ncbi:HdeD family acid-resistance protein [Longispora sp. K20-0274]|uniref:HdeD family acid-resistance protein n=1 Tax=Longispora sp. K20-0274 TaxID=3088255 RepID=UPI0039994D65
MLELLARNWWLVVLRGVLAVVFGVMAIAWPGVTVLALVLVWGVYALIDGATAGWLGITGRGEHRWLMVLMGVAGVIAGIGTFVWPGITALVLLVFVATWSIIIGLLYLYAAWQIRKEVTGEWLLYVSGALFVLLGIVLLARPGQGLVALAVTLGIWSIVWGVSLVFYGFRLRGLAGTSHPSRI